jgi:hypothetical protein
VLYRVFPFHPDARPDEAGGPLYVPREHQGAGRHDNSYQYGALYVSRLAESAVAENIQAFRGQNLNDADLRLVGGATVALATFDDSRLERLVDLDDPLQLASRQLRPSMVATRDRTVTRGIALRIFDEGLLGLSWWSTHDASWTNVTLFAERASSLLALVGPPEPLSVHDPVVRAAAQRIGVLLA